MFNDWSDFERQHDYLVCVDSDGCAMDTMDIKHINCFGPRMVEEWDLQEWSEPILERWNEINLYSLTRGINRFKGLAKALGEIDKKYKKIDGVEELQEWVDSGAAPSNAALQEALDNGGHPILQKALDWSKAVNQCITELPDEVKKPFEGAGEGLAAASKFADVAIVSSANREAVLDEWTEHGLLDHVDIVLAQDCGSKAHCISEMMKFGYEPDHVLMVGDAPGDLDAAQVNGVHYFPILVRNEGKSWAELAETGLGRLRDGEYAPYEKERIEEFVENLGG